MEPSNRVIALLAASGISLSEIRDFVASCKHWDADEISRAISRARHRVRNLDVELDRLDRSNSFERGADASSASLIRDVQRLHADAGFSVRETVDLITERLRDRFPDKAHPKFSAKDGFNRWLVRVSDEFGESVVLSAAVDALNRNRSSHDWRLS